MNTRHIAAVTVLLAVAVVPVASQPTIQAGIDATNAAATIAAGAGIPTIHIPGFSLVNQFSLPAAVPGPLGDVLFSADGNTLFILGGSEGPNSGVWSVPVTRDPSGNVIELGAATAVFAIPEMDTSLELKPGTETLFFRMTGGRVGERRPDGTIAIFDAALASSLGGLAFVPDPLPNAGDLLVGSFSSGVIFSHSLTDNLDGTFTPVLQGFYSNSQSGATGDLHFIPTSAFANDLMFTNWSNGTVSIIDIDPATGLPLGGGGTPSITLFASDLGVGPWGLDFDPISGNLFIANWAGTPSNGILQISGFPAPSGCLAVTSQEVVCHADGTTFTVNIEGLNACTGGTTQVTFTASGGAVGEELCFTVLVNADGGFCCSTEICVTIPDCTSDCDLNGDGIVGMVDFLALLGAWGSCSDCGNCPADFDGDCSVGILDLLILLGHWG